MDVKEPKTTNLSQRGQEDYDYVLKAIDGDQKFKIAINNCIDHIRKKRIKLLSIDDPIEHDSSYDTSKN